MPKAKLVITVDYEGNQLDEENLNVFRKFQDDHPDVPLTHLLNPTHILTSNSLDETIAKLMSLIKPGDEIGMHIHGHRILVEQAGVRFNEDFVPYFDRKNKYWTPFADSRLDGYESLLEESYEQGELERIISFGKRILYEAGFEVGKSFRMGGWLTGAKSFAAIRAAGFEIDCSAQSPDWLAKYVESKMRLYKPSLWFPTYEVFMCVKDYWGHVSPYDFPGLFETPYGPLTEMPNTGSLADYVTVRQMTEHIAKLVKMNASYVFPHIGFHDSNCVRYLPRIVKTVEFARDVKKLSFCTLSQAKETFALSAS